MAIVWIVAILLHGTSVGDSFGDAINGLSENSADNAECRTSGGEKYGDTQEIRGNYTIERKYFYSQSLGKCLSETTVLLSGSLDRNTIVDVDTGEVLAIYDKTCVGVSCTALDEYEAEKAGFR